MVILTSIISAIFLIVGLFMFRRYPNHKYKLTYSIVIVAHNEADMLEPLLVSLTKLDYDRKSYEIILVDDNSTDKTFLYMQYFANKFENCTAIQPDSKYSDYYGKKAALQTAVDIAKNDILLFTDADAAVPTNWISSYNRFFSEDYGFVIGWIRGENIKNIKKFKRIISSGIFAAMAGLRKPFSCSGGNLAIRRKTLLEIGGYSSIKESLSGDDKQLLGLVAKTEWKVAYNPDSRVIERERDLTPSQDMNQALRHYGKFSMSSTFHKFFSIIILFFYLLLPYLIYKNILILPIYLAGIIAFYFSSCVLHKERFTFEDIFWSLAYPYYMVFFSLVGTFSGFKWKK